MEYRRFGRTEIQIPVISVGGMRYQTSWKREDEVKRESVEKLKAIVEHAFAAGLTHLETAFGYGTSEVELGEVLADCDRDTYILQTKGGPKETLKEFLENLETSMKCLRTDRLDLFAVHGINNLELLDQTIQTGILDELHKLKSQGVIRAIGFSTHATPDVIVKIIETDAFDYVNLWHSYIYPFNTGAIDAATARDMGVFIISPNDKGGMLFDPPQKLADLTAPLHPMVFNDSFILSNPKIHTISCGAAQPTDFDIHIEAVEQMDGHRDTVEQIRQRLDAELDKVISPEWAKNYLQGLPNFNNTPANLNIPIIVWLWNLTKAFDMIKYAQMRFNLMGNAEHWFPGCKPQAYPDIDRGALRDCLSESPYTDRIIDILDEAHNLLTAEEVKRISETE